MTLSASGGPAVLRRPSRCPSTSSSATGSAKTPDLMNKCAAVASQLSPGMALRGAARPSFTPAATEGPHCSKPGVYADPPKAIIQIESTEWADTGAATSTSAVTKCFFFLFRHMMTYLESVTEFVIVRKRNMLMTRRFCVSVTHDKMF